MYVICFFDKITKVNVWELVSGEDAMQNRVSELCEDGLDAEDDIFVFDAEDEIK